MAQKFLDQNGLLYTLQKVKADFVKKETGKALSTNDFTNDEKAKLAGIAEGAQANVLESVKVNGTALKITDKAVDVTVPTKTSQIANDSGFITSADIPEGAAASTTSPLMAGEAAVGTEMAFARGDHRHPSDTSKVDKTTTINGHALSASFDLTPEDVGAAAAEHNHAEATTSVAGMMSAADKAKLDGIATGATKITVDTALSATSTNPVENKAINTALAGKADVEHNHAEATTSVAGMMSAADKLKLDGIEAGANKTVVDADLSASSTNPVENKAVKAALDAKADSTHTHNYAGSATPGGPATTALECTGNAATATKLAAGRVITIGNQEQTFDGSADIAFDLSQMGAIPATAKGSANGVATLDADGKVPAAQLPSYVDDVVEGYYSEGAFYKEEAFSTEITGESSKIYVDLATNKSYRFGGTVYVEISSGDMVAISNEEIESIYASA